MSASNPDSLDPQLVRIVEDALEKVRQEVRLQVLDSLNDHCVLTLQDVGELTDVQYCHMGLPVGAAIRLKRLVRRQASNAETKELEGAEKNCREAQSPTSVAAVGGEEQPLVTVDISDDLFAMCKQVSKPTVLPQNVKMMTMFSLCLFCALLSSTLPLDIFKHTIEDNGEMIANWVGRHASFDPQPRDKRTPIERQLKEVTGNSMMTALKEKPSKAALAEAGKQWVAIAWNKFCKDNGRKTLHDTGAQVSVEQCQLDVLGDPDCGFFMYGNGDMCKCMHENHWCQYGESSTNNTIFKRAMLDTEIATKLASRLLDQMPYKSGVAPLTLPQRVGREGVDITFEIEIQRLLKYDENTGMATLYVGAYYYWIDRLLLYNSSQHFPYWHTGNKLLLPADSVWKPDVFAYQAYDVKCEGDSTVEVFDAARAEKEHFNVHLFKMCSLTLNCAHNNGGDGMKDFPFDGHECLLAIGPRRDNQFQNIKTNNNIKESLKDAVSEKWSITLTSTERKRVSYHGIYDVIHIKLKFTRKPHMVIDRAVMPLLMLVLASSAGLWVPLNTGTRIGLSSMLFIMTVLTVVVSKQFLPPSSHITWLDRFGRAALNLTFIPVFWAVIVQRFVHVATAKSEELAKLERSRSSVRSPTASPMSYTATNSPPPEDPTERLILFLISRGLGLGNLELIAITTQVVVLIKHFLTLVVPNFNELQVHFNASAIATVVFSFLLVVMWAFGLVHMLLSKKQTERPEGPPVTLEMSTASGFGHDASAYGHELSSSTVGTPRTPRRPGASWGSRSAGQPRGTGTASSSWGRQSANPQHEIDFASAAMRSFAAITRPASPRGSHI